MYICIMLKGINQICRSKDSCPPNYVCKKKGKLSRKRWRLKTKNKKKSRKSKIINFFKQPFRTKSKKRKNEEQKTNNTLNNLDYYLNLQTNDHTEKVKKYSAKRKKEMNRINKLKEERERKRRLQLERNMGGLFGHISEHNPK